MEKLRRETEEADKLKKQKQFDEGPNASFGYGGKFGVEKDRMDQSAVGHDYLAKLEKHESQKDYSTGFGGKFGVQTDRVDKVINVNCNKIILIQYSITCRVLLVGITKRKLKNMPHKKITVQDLVVNLVYKKTGKINLLLVGIMSKK